MGLFDWMSNFFGGQKPPSREAPRRTATPVPTRALPPRPAARPEPVAPRRPESRKLEGLEAAQFAPLSDAEASREAKALGRPTWSSPWFGRRDLIPPTTDPRTVLIDRLMVSEGLTKPEELADIHAVGAEMDRVRPDLAHATVRANQAVGSSQQERARRKAEKKVAALERKRLRAEAIAERKRTDIIFLGRGVSRGLSQRESNAEKLELHGLPVLSTPQDLAQAMGLDIKTLRWLAFNSEAASRIHYVQFTAPKKSGGVRVLASPHRKLRSAQRWILEHIVARIPIHQAAHGFVAGRGIVTNAAAHVGCAVVINCDLKDFFPSITFPRIEGFFRSVGYSGAVATILALVVTESPRQLVNYAGRELWVATGPRALPQGACTSPALSNAISWRLDRRLQALSHKLGLSYTRYADDLTFSAAEPMKDKIGYILARVRHIVQDEGFTIHPQKTRVQKQSSRQTVTGLVVNERVSVARKTVRELRAILHNARRTGLAAQNRQQHPDFEAHLEGMIAYVRMVNESQGDRLQEEWNLLRG